MFLAKIITILMVIFAIPMILVVWNVVLTRDQETQFPEGISLKEQQQIEAWIKENELNRYGDPKDTVYIAGNPLFDKKTGKPIDKYEYILKNHPQRPWRK